MENKESDEKIYESIQLCSSERKKFILGLEKLLEKYKKHLSIQDLAYDLLVTGGLMVFYNAPTPENAMQFLEMCLEHVGIGYNKLKERNGKDK